MEICGIKHLRIEYMNARRSPEAMFESCEDIFHRGGRKLKPKLYEFALNLFPPPFRFNPAFRRPLQRLWVLKLIPIIHKSCHKKGEVGGSSIISTFPKLEVKRKSDEWSLYIFWRAPICGYRWPSQLYLPPICKSRVSLWRDIHAQPSKQNYELLELLA